MDKGANLSIPEELLVEIYHRCDYPSQIIMYNEFLPLSKALAVDDPCYRYLNEKEMCSIFNKDDLPHFRYFLELKPSKFYVESYYGSLIDIFIYIVRNRIKCYRIIEYLLK